MDVFTLLFIILFFLSSVPQALLFVSALLLGGRKQHGVHTQADGEQPTFPHLCPGTADIQYAQHALNHACDDESSHAHTH